MAESFAVPSGYSTIPLAIAAIVAKGSLVGDGNNTIDIADGHVHNGALDFTGVQAATDGRVFLRSVGRWTLNLSSTATLNGNITVQNMLIRPASGFVGTTVVNDGSSVNNVISNFEADNPSGINTSFAQWSADFRNNDVIDGTIRDYNGGFKNAIVEAGTCRRVTVDSCTGGFVNGRDVIDCAASRITDDDFRGNSSLVNCASSDATATGTGAITGIVAATEYVNPDAGDFTLRPGSQLIGAGSTGNNIGFYQTDAVAPTFTVQPEQTGLSDTLVNVNFTSDETGTFRLLVVNDGATTPTAAQVLAGTGSAGTTVAFDSTIRAMSAATSESVAVTGLTATTPYDIYVAMQDASGNTVLGTLLEITTTAQPDTVAPDFDAQPEITDISTTSVEVTFDTNENGFYRAVALANNSTAPTVDDVLNGDGASGSTPIFDSTLLSMDIQTPPAVLISPLEPGESYDIYIALQDAAGNKRLSSRIDALTLASGNLPPAIGSNPTLTTTSGLVYTYNVSTSDPDGDAVTLTAPVLPSWLTLSGNTLSGTPADANAGNNAVTLRASDGTTNSEQSFVISVQIPTAQSDTNNGAHDARALVSNVTNVTLTVLSADGSVRQGVVIGGFQQTVIPVINPGGSAPRYQHLWNNYSDKGAVLGEETYSFALDPASTPFGDRVFRTIIGEERPYPEIYPYESPGGWKYIKEVIDSGTWKLNTFNRLRLWFRLPEGFQASTPGTTNLHFGTYVRGTTGSTLSAESGGGNHYYHYANVPPTGEIHQWIIDFHPHHRRGFQNPNEEWSIGGGHDIEYPTNEPGYNYFDLMTRFYDELKPIGFQFPSYPVQMDWLGVEAYEEVRPESIEKIYSLNGTYQNSNSENTVHLGWARIKADDVTTHEVRYAFSDIHLLGWANAVPAPGGIITPPNGGAYNNMAYTNSTINMGSNSTLFLAIKVTGDPDTNIRQFEMPLNFTAYPTLGGNA